METAVLPFLYYSLDIDSPMALDGSCHEVAWADRQVHPTVAPEASGMVVEVVRALYSSLKAAGAMEKFA
jgi:hypothetical protein